MKTCPPIEPDRAQHEIEQLARRADERLALPILLGPRRLADDHQVGLPVADAEHRLGAGLAQRAAAAVANFGLQRRPCRVGRATGARVARQVARDAQIVESCRPPQVHRGFLPGSVAGPAARPPP